MDFDSNRPLYTSAPHNEHISPIANNVESMSLTGDTRGNSKAVEPPKPKQNVRFKRNLPGYRFEDSIREYCPSKLQSKENLKKTKESYTVNGVNMLNKSDMDSSTALNRIKKKREQHNRVERRRRDMINSAIEEIAEIVPKVEDKEKSARGDVLRLTIDYIRELQSELESLKIENEVLKQNDGSMAQYPRLDPAKRPPTIVIERPHVNNDHHNPWTSQFNSVENSPTYSEVSSNNLGSNCSSPIYGNVPLLSPASHSTNSPLLSPVSHSTNSPTLSPVSPIDNLANPWRRNSAGAQLMPISGHSHSHSHSQSYEQNILSRSLPDHLSPAGSFQYSRPSAEADRFHHVPVPVYQDNRLSPSTVTYHRRHSASSESPRSVSPVPMEISTAHPSKPLPPDHFTFISHPSTVNPEVGASHGPTFRAQMSPAHATDTNHTVEPTVPWPYQQ